MYEPSTHLIVTQVGDTGTDHSYWGRPEQQTGYRPTKRAALADVLGNTAAALAAASMVLAKPGAQQVRSGEEPFIAHGLITGLHTSE